MCTGGHKIIVPSSPKPLKGRNKGQRGKDATSKQPATPRQILKVQGDEDVEMTHGTQQNDANPLLEKGPQDAVEPCRNWREAPGLPRRLGPVSAPGHVLHDSLTRMCPGWEPGSMLPALLNLGRFL